MVNFQEIKTRALLAVGMTSVIISGLYHDNQDHKSFLSTVQDTLPNPFKHDEAFKKVLSKYENHCINNKDRTKLSTLELYEEFIKGPCAPMIILPGILGTSLQLKIDCELLQSNNPQIFSSCGWSTCSRFNIFKTRPASEYRLWIGDIVSKTNFLQFSDDSKCFGDLVGLAYNKESNKLVAKDGLEVTWYGNTEETKANKNCGANSIKDLSNDLILKEASCSIRGYGNLIDLLETMGYQSGLTYQAVPYDFRQDVAQSNTQLIIPKAIDQIYQMTGKKSIILGHSLGNLHILNSLNNIKQEIKDQKVKEFVAAGPPFLGAPKAFINMLGGDPDYLKVVLGKQIGMNFYSQKEFTQSCSSSYDILQKDTFNRFKNEEWMKEIMRRVQYEESGEYDSTIPYNFLPDPKNTCYNSGIFKARQEGKCSSGLYNLLKGSIVKINGEEFKATYEDIQKIILNHATYNPEQTLSLLKKSFEAEGLHDIKNPNIPVSIIYGNMLETVKSFEYLKDTKEVYEQTKTFYFPENMELGVGDGTVPSFSAIVPALKWAYEHKKEQINSRPIKLVEFCSNIDQDKPFYDNKSSSGENVSNETQYRGIGCDCAMGNNVGNCYHSCFINDSQFLDFIAQSLITGQKSDISLGTFTNEQLDALVESCPVLNA